MARIAPKELGTNLPSNLIGPTVKHYVDACYDALKDAGVPPGRVVHIAPGRTPAWDDCCDGQLYGRVQTIVPNVGKAPMAGSLPCGVLSWTATISIGIIRCAATVNDNGTPPAAWQVSADGWTMTDDLTILQQVIICEEATRSIGNWTPLEVQGGCHGGEWTFTVALAACNCD